MYSENQSKKKRVKFICECREIKYDDNCHDHHYCKREEESKCQCKKCCYKESNGYW